MFLLSQFYGGSILYLLLLVYQIDANMFYSYVSDHCVHHQQILIVDYFINFDASSRDSRCLRDFSNDSLRAGQIITKIEVEGRCTVS